MAVNYSWGSWEERWPKGRFCCVFVEAHPASNGMLRAAGLYRAVDGDVLDDIATFEERIAERTAVVGEQGGGVLIRKEFAELLAIMPAFLEEVSERFESAEMAESGIGQANRPRHDAQSAVGRTLPRASQGAEFLERVPNVASSGISHGAPRP